MPVPRRRIFLLPMLADGRAGAHQPFAVFDLFQQIRRGEILDAVGRWIAQRFQQPGRHQRREVMRLAIDDPRRLLRRQAGRQLAQQLQKLMLVIVHFLSAVTFTHQLAAEQANAFCWRLPMSLFVIVGRQRFRQRAKEICLGVIQQRLGIPVGHNPPQLHDLLFDLHSA